MAHRFRDRSVTQLLYKPGLHSGLARGRPPADPDGAGLDGGGGGGGSAGRQTTMRRASEVRQGRQTQLQAVRIVGTERRATAATSLSSHPREGC